MADADLPHAVLPSAREDVARVREVPATPQTLSRSYGLAFTDVEFLLREELRLVRLQLELLKPELEAQGQQHRIDHRHLRQRQDRRACRRGERCMAAEAASAVRHSRTRGSPGPRSSPASSSSASRSYEEARRFARLVSTARRPDGQQRAVIVGGGPGIMEAANWVARTRRGDQHRPQHRPAARAGAQPLDHARAVLPVPLLRPAQDALRTRARALWSFLAGLARSTNCSRSCA